MNCLNRLRQTIAVAWVILLGCCACSRTPPWTSKTFGMGAIWDIAVSADGKHLAVAGETSAFVYRMDTFERVCALGDPADEIRNVAFSPDGTTLALGRHGRITLLDVATTEQVHQLLGHTETWYRSVAFSPDGTTVAAGAMDHTVTLWHLGKAESGE